MPETALVKILLEAGPTGVCFSLLFFQWLYIRNSREERYKFMELFAANMKIVDENTKSNALLAEIIQEQRREQTECRTALHRNSDALLRRPCMRDANQRREVGI